MKIFILLTSFLVLLSSAGSAQTITVAESRCVNNGSIFVSGTVGSGGPYQLSITNHPPDYTPGPAHFPLALPDTFSALFPGQYTLRVTDGSGGIFTFGNILVDGNYVLPGNNDYAPVTTPVTTCTLANGSIAGIMTNGRPPYTYTILSGPAQTGVTNITGDFTGLPAGTYLVQAADSCQNIQTREVTVTGGAGSISITGASISVVNCDSFSLDALTVTPALLPGGRFEVINISSSGASVVRASGSVLPARFTLYSKLDVPERRVRIRVYDACGNFSTFTPSQFTNSPVYRISRVVVNKISCDSMSLDSIYLSSPLPQGASISVFNFNPGPDPVVYAGVTLPLRFKASYSDFSRDKIKVNVIDSCGDLLVTYNARDIKNKWDFTPVFSFNCNELRISNVVITGSVFQPYTISAGVSFTNGAGQADSTGTFVVDSFPFYLPGIPRDANPLLLSMTMRDSCGDEVNYIKDLSFTISESAAEPADCNNTTVSFEPDGFFRLPVTYAVSPDNGTGTNTNGVFTLPPGVYVFTAVDSCGKKYTTVPATFQRGWQLNPAEQSSLCHVNYISNRIAVPAGSYGQLTIKQYLGAMPVAVGALPLSTRNYTSLANGCVTCPVTAVTGEWIQFDSTLPAQTYSYVLTDSCGRSDTVSITNVPVGYAGFFRNTRVLNKCINKGDIIASWSNDGPSWNTVTVTVLGINRNPIFIFTTSSNTNLNTHPNGQTLLSNYPPARYIVEYSFSDCPLVYTDTVTIASYQQPVVTSAESLPSCGTGSNVIVTASKGVLPYSYQIIGTTPGNFSTAPQASAAFAFAAAQATVTVRIVDACLNSSTRTVAVVKAYPPVIRSNPGVLAACSLPLNFMLFTDSLFAGSVFEWTKISGTGSGSQIISRRPSLSLVYNSIADTGAYRVRVHVPNTCYDLSAEYRVPPVVITCIANLGGTVLNDANGLTDNIVNGRGTNAGGLFVSLVNAGGNVSAIAPVVNNGSYQLLNVAAGDYSLLLSTVPGIENEAAPPVVLPAGWVHTGEHTAVLPGNDGIVNGKLININVGTAAISNLNFGIEQLPVARDTIEARVNPGGNIRIPVPVMTGNDAEDGIYDGVSGINTVVIQSLPANAVLYYNAIAVVEGQTIINYNPVLLTIDPNDNIASTSFTFSEVDAAMQQSIPATVTILFYGLPVEIVSFTASTHNGNVVLNWQVGEQVDILAYVIEFSTDGIKFSHAGSITASNQQLYLFTHLSPVNGTNFYRLKITAHDGSFTYSKIATARFSVTQFVQVLPNPFSDHINLLAQLIRPCAVRIIIYDAAGRKVHVDQFDGIAGSNNFVIDNLGKISTGMYTISVMADGFIYNSKVAKY